MQSLKIAIIGSRGIPNCYGGFEQLAQYLAEGLAKAGHSITVYNSHKHPYQKNEWNAVQIIHCYDGEHFWGTAGQFFYDRNCIRNAKKNGFDVILFLGYTSSSVWWRSFPKNAIIISNMDGLEWKRSKYSKPVQQFLQYAEKLAIKNSDHYIADSPVIQSYLKMKYGVESSYIPYGATTGGNVNEALLAPFLLTKQNYFMLMARLEPENNIEMILDGFHQSRTDKQFIVVGNTNTAFGRKMVNKFGTDERIHFAGAIYDAVINHTLRSFCCMYFHGHSVGGTNPSLLEAMADGSLIAAHDNAFNRGVLQDDAFYFTNATEVQQLVESTQPGKGIREKVQNNFTKIEQQYNWPAVIEQYEKFITNCYNRSAL
jgi:glycosyltransferase involved in cell wall biosynthesis